VSVTRTQPDPRPAAPAHSSGHARLQFKRAGEGKTFVSKQSVCYPFHITRPFYLAGDPPGMATVYLQSVSGGIYRDDKLELSLEAKRGARAHVTTQSATIVHGMAGEHATQRLTLAAREGALLEYWPDPMILFPGAGLHSVVSIELGPGATVLLGDAYLNHDPGGRGRRFAKLACEIRVTRESRHLACVERFSVTGTDMAEHGVTAGFADAAYATVLFLYDIGAYPSLLATAQRAMDEDKGVYAGASMLPADTGLCAKVLAPDPHTLNSSLYRLWQTLRTTLTGLAPRERRK